MHTLTKQVSVCVATWGVATGLALAASQIPDPLPRSDGKPADMSKPVKVFILLGQSNMLGFGKINGGEGSLDNAVKNKGKYAYLVDATGAWVERKDVRFARYMSGRGPLANEWMGIKGGNIGPEIGIGFILGTQIDAPVLILKCCIGNRSLGWDLLPPGSEPYDGQPGYRGTPQDLKGNGEIPAGAGWYAGKQWDDDTGDAKRALADLATHYPEAKKYEVTGFFLWQGEKDGGNPVHAANYEKNLVAFIKALRKEFNVPQAKFVCATMGEATKGSGNKVMEGQLAVDGKEGKYPEFKGNVATVYSNPLSMGGGGNGHYGGNAETYMNVGEAMGRAMAELVAQDGPKGSLMSKGGKAGAAAPVPELRKARKLAAGKESELNQRLLKTLVTLSEAKLLKALPIPLSVTQAKVSLVSAKADKTLTFRSDNGKTADLKFDTLKTIDYANLAILASLLKPDNDVTALSGVYLECAGRVEAADKKYVEAGEKATQSLQAYFE
jgi:hypothetical protein